MARAKRILSNCGLLAAVALIALASRSGGGERRLENARANSQSILVPASELPDNATVIQLHLDGSCHFGSVSLPSLNAAIDIIERGGPRRSTTILLKSESKLLPEDTDLHRLRSVAARVGTSVYFAPALGGGTLAIGSGTSKVISAPLELLVGSRHPRSQAD